MQNRQWPSDKIQRIKFIREVTGMGLKEAKEAVEAADGDLKMSLSILSKKHPHWPFNHNVKRRQCYASFYKELTGKELENPVREKPERATINDFRKDLQKTYVLCINKVPVFHSKRIELLERKAKRYHNKKTKVQIIPVDEAT
jgi:hypothetical protein